MEIEKVKSNERMKGKKECFWENENYYEECHPIIIIAYKNEKRMVKKGKKWGDDLIMIFNTIFFLIPYSIRIKS